MLEPPQAQHLKCRGMHVSGAWAVSLPQARTLRGGSHAPGVTPSHFGVPQATNCGDNQRALAAEGRGARAARLRACLKSVANTTAAAPARASRVGAGKAHSWPSPPRRAQWLSRRRQLARRGLHSVRLIAQMAEKRGGRGKAVSTYYRARGEGLCGRRRDHDRQTGQTSGQTGHHLASHPAGKSAARAAGWPRVCVRGPARGAWNWPSFREGMRFYQGPVAVGWLARPGLLG